MAVDIFMKIDGVSGESTDTQFKEWIELLSINWKVECPASPTAQHGLRSSEFGVTKAVDKASPQIFKAMTNREQISEIRLAFCRAGKEKVKYLEYVFKKCVLTKFELQMANKSEEPLPTESIEFRFASVEITYCQQKRDTGGSAGQIGAAWNLSEWS
jgi:type VI secretion system secreted protein Hcp